MRSVSKFFSPPPDPRLLAARERPRTSRHRAGAAALVAVFLATAACGGAPTAPEAAGPRSTGTVGTEAQAGPAQTGGRLVVGISGETDNFNPFAGAWSSPAYAVANAIFEPLVALDEAGSAKPYLAESMVASTDFRSWTITLRPGIVFHDGSPLDSSAVKRNLDAAKTTGLTSQAFTPMESVTATDDKTVVVAMSSPWSSFPNALASQAGYVVAPSMLDDPARASAVPVGTGPFVFEGRQRDSFVNVKRNPTYWRKDEMGTALPYLDAIEFKIITDPSSRTKTFEARDADAIQVDAPAEIAAAKERASRSEVNLLGDTKSETDEAVIALNASKPPFDDISARKALQYAIDQSSFADLSAGGIEPAWGLFQEGSPWYITKADAGYPERNIETAKELADQFEKDHGQKLAFTLNVLSDPQSLQQGQIIQSQLLEAGIVTEIQPLERAAGINKVIVTGDYQASYFNMWSAPAPDKGYFFVATKANPNGLSLNYSRLDDLDLTTAFDEYRATTDPGRQKAALTTVQRQLAKNVPMIFLNTARLLFMYDTRVHGFNANSYPGSKTHATGAAVATPFYTQVWVERP